MINDTSKFAIFLVCCCSVFSTIPASGQERTWIDNTGNNRIEAELLGVEKVVRLRKKNGVVITVPFSRLSAADIAYLERLEADTKVNSSATAQRQPNRPDPARDAKSNLPTTPTDVVGQVKPDTNSKSSSPVVRNSPQRQPDARPPVKSPTVSKSQNTGVKQTNTTPRMDEAELAIIRLTLKDLKTDWPDSPSPELLKKISSYTESGDKLIRSSALALLGEHEPQNSFDLIVRRLDDSSFEVRWQAYDILESLGDRRAIDPLIERFSGEDCSKISSVLQSFGGEIEEKIIPFLSDPSVDVRLSACDLLGNIGSGESVASLENLRENATELAVRMQAQSALREIASRN